MQKKLQNPLEFLQLFCANLIFFVQSEILYSLKNQSIK